jgi:hypothetical protein
MGWHVVLDREYAVLLASASHAHSVRLAVDTIARPYGNAFSTF